MKSRLTKKCLPQLGEFVPLLYLVGTLHSHEDGASENDKEYEDDEESQNLLLAHGYRLQKRSLPCRRQSHHFKKATVIGDSLRVVSEPLQVINESLRAYTHQKFCDLPQLKSEENLFPRNVVNWCYAIAKELIQLTRDDGAYTG